MEAAPAQREKRASKPPDRYAPSDARPPSKIHGPTSNEARAQHAADLARQREEHRASIGPLFQRLGFTCHVLCTAEEAGTRQAPTVYTLDKGLFSPAERQLCYAAGKVVIPENHPKFLKGMTHAHGYFGTLDSSQEDRTIINVAKDRFTQLMEARLRVPTVQVVAQGGPPPGPHWSGVPGLLESAHQDAHAVWFGAGRGVDAWRYLEDLPRPFNFYLVKDKVAKKLFSTDAAAVIMNAAAAGVGEEGFVYHERQHMHSSTHSGGGVSFGADFVRTARGEKHKASWMEGNKCYNTFTIAAQPRLPQALEPTGNSMRAGGGPAMSVLQSAEQRALTALITAVPTPDTPHCGYCLSTDTRDIPAFVRQELLCCQACRSGYATAFASLPREDRPAVTHGGHPAAGCGGCVRQGVVVDKRKTGPKRKAPKNRFTRPNKRSQNNQKSA